MNTKIFLYIISILLSFSILTNVYASFLIKEKNKVNKELIIENNGLNQRLSFNDRRNILKKQILADPWIFYDEILESQEIINTIIYFPKVGCYSCLEEILLRFSEKHLNDESIIVCLENNGYFGDTDPRFGHTDPPRFLFKEQYKLTVLQFSS